MTFLVAETPREPNERIEQTTLDDERINEASGMARSFLQDDVLWLHNDSGGTAELYAVTTSGHYLGAVTINNAVAIDWEDMTSFELDGTSYLLVGDVGDNNAVRPQIQFYVIAEPEIVGLADDFSISADVAWQFTASYSDGPRDCESVAVDTSEESIYLLSKRDTPPQLYRLPLRPSVAVTQAEYLGDVSTIPAPTEQDLQEPFGESRAQPTAMDFSSDGSFAYLVTYKDAYIYQRAANESWLQAFARKGVLVDLPQLLQTEAGAIGAPVDQSSLSLHAASEQLPAVLVNVTKPVSID